MKKRYLLLILIVVFGALLWILVKSGTASAPTETNTPSPTALAPAPLPAQKDDLITVTAPLPGTVISSPLIIRGSARGSWYFEGSFPIVLTDGTGTVLAQGHASAQGEWMTTDYVPFTATLTYSTPTEPANRSGFLILKKDNPSGDPSRDNALTIPVTL